MSVHPNLDGVALDADDTLWHNEELFRQTQAEFRRLLSNYHDDDWIEQRLYDTEMRNLAHFGYGVKSFMLSMVETALELTEGRIQGVEVQRILELGKAMLAAPVQLLDGVADTLETLAGDYRLVLITKGDLLHQESKVERSGLRSFFRAIEVVSNKDAPTYARVLSRHGIRPDRFVMAGDSLRSDVLPVLELGGWGVHIPYPTVWQHEAVDGAPPTGPRFARLATIAELPALLRGIAERA